MKGSDQPESKQDQDESFDLPSPQQIETNPSQQRNPIDVADQRHIAEKQSHTKQSPAIVLRFAIERVIVKIECAKKKCHGRGMRPEIGYTEEEERTEGHEPPGSSDKFLSDPFAHVGEKQENRQSAEHRRYQPLQSQPGKRRKQRGPARIVFGEATALGIIHRVCYDEFVEWMRPIVDRIFRIELTARKQLRLVQISLFVA